MPSPTRNSNTARSSNTSDFLPPGGSSSSVATFSKSDMLSVDTQFPFDRLAECFAHRLDGDPVVDAVEEALDDHVHGLVPRESAAHAIKNLLGVHLAGRGSVRAAHVVGLDFEPGNG